MPPTLVLLPGLHGTADLFGPFLDAVPDEYPRRCVSYPIEQPLSYDQLLDRVKEELKGESAMVLIAESFSGPLAIRFAAANPDRVRALILCASFIRLPKPPLIRRLLAPILFRLPISLIALRHYLIGADAPPGMLLRVRQSLQNSRPKVLLARLRESFRVDCTGWLQHCAIPLLYLRGNEDRVMPRKALEPILALLPGTIVREIPGPHMLLEARPAECWREIDLFLRGALLTSPRQPVAASEASLSAAPNASTHTTQPQ